MTVHISPTAEPTRPQNKTQKQLPNGGIRFAARDWLTLLQLSVNLDGGQEKERG